MSLTAISLPRIGGKNIFHELDVQYVQKVGIKRFWTQDAEMSLTVTTQRVPASKMKTFHELDVHYVQKVGIKRFWTQEAEMSLTASSVFQQAR